MNVDRPASAGRSYSVTCCRGADSAVSTRGLAWKRSGLGSVGRDDFPAQIEHGQAVEQLPEKGPTGTPNPDIEINGVKGDVYSPQGSNLNTISQEIVRKSSWTGPAVVVNLTDSNVTIEALVAEIKAYPGDALRDLYIIKPGSDGVAIIRHLTFER